MALRKPEGKEVDSISIEQHVVWEESGTGRAAKGKNRYFFLI